jgi:hypothetical protein
MQDAGVRDPMHEIYGLVAKQRGSGGDVDGLMSQVLMTKSSDVFYAWKFEQPHFHFFLTLEDLYVLVFARPEAWRLGSIYVWVPQPIAIATFFIMEYIGLDVMSNPSKGRTQSNHVIRHYMDDTTERR